MQCAKLSETESSMPVTFSLMDGKTLRKTQMLLTISFGFLKAERNRQRFSTMMSTLLRGIHFLGFAV